MSMQKKKYLQPMIIDLSIEAVTGIGASEFYCGNGDSAATACSSTGNSPGTPPALTCYSNGNGATGTNSNSCQRGVGVSGGCLDGGLPHTVTGYCNYGGSATGANSTCAAGNTALGQCLTGDSASAKDTAACGGGSTPSYCVAGNNQAFSWSS